MQLRDYYHRHLYALILAGGVGVRFWPFSRELEPKQFLKIIGAKSLLQDTVIRLLKILPPSHIHVITNKSHFYELKKQIEAFRIPEDNIILEPEGKNTAPAIGLFAQLIRQKDEQAIFISLPCDHYIKDTHAFKDILMQALVPALKGFLVTIGIRPQKPATGYGYIKVKPKGKTPDAKYYLVERFIEKPNIKEARKYFCKANYFWNSGIFIWKASVFMEEVKICLPGLFMAIKNIKDKADIPVAWPKIKPISVDYGILERSRKIALVKGEFCWSDLGSWDALGDILPKDVNKNIIQADSLNQDSKGICIFSRGNRLICTIGLRDLIIADTPDALLVCDKNRAQEVKYLVDKLKNSKRKEHFTHLTQKRPWGAYTVLQFGHGFKIKLVEVEPGKRLSLQSHKKRAEHWVVVSGSARITYGNDVKIIKSNQSIYIPSGIKHRLENSGKVPLKIVEVQTGEYLEEDDIQRFDDDFRR